MDNLKIKISLSFLILLLSAPAWAGGGWTPAAGAHYLKLGQYSILARNYYTPAGDRVPIFTTQVHISSVYWEYGLSDKVGVVAYVPFFSRSTLNEVVRPDGELVQEGDQLNGFGDPEVRLKVSLYRQGPWAIAGSIGLGLPLGNPAGGNTMLLQTGDGEFNQKLLLEASRSFQEGKGYATATVGFNNRTQGFSEEFIYGLEGGIKAGSFWLIGKVNGLESFKNGGEDLSVNNGIFANNLEYLVVSPSVAWQAGKSWGITADAGFALRGERILADPSYSLGVFWEW